MPAQGKHAPWRLWILIVFWVLQLLFLLANLVIYILAIVVIFRTNSRVNYTSSAKIGICVQFILVLCSLTLCISEIVHLSRHRLTPRVYLMSNVLKSSIWTGLTIGSLIVSRDDGTTSAVAIVITVIMLLLFILPMIYGAIIFHRTKNNLGKYVGVQNANDPTAYNGVVDSTAYKADVPLTSTTAYGGQVPYNAQSYSATQAYGTEMPTYGGHPHQQHSNA